jgi:DNA-binding response OmpR family regulator
MTNKLINILVTEDSEADIFLLKHYLKKKNIKCNLEFASTLDEFQDKLQTNPDLFIFDLNMNELSGIDALKKVRANDKYKSTPVFILSGSDWNNDINQCKAAGANDYMVKPFEVNEFLNRIKNIDCFAVEVKEDETLIVTKN